MADNTRITDMAAATALTGAELLEVSQLSTSVTYTATTLSAAASDNSYNDSANQFVAEGFAVGNRVKVTGFTGNVANNILVGTITALTAGKMTIGGTDGDVIVDDAAGESVTISKWGTARATTQDVADLGGGSSGGTYDIPIHAAAMTPRTTTGAAAGSAETTTNKVMKVTYDFDAAADEFAQFQLPMQKSWNEGTITAKFIWTADAGTAAQVARWGIQAVAISDDDALDAAFGTAQEVDDALLATGDVHHSAFTSAITIGGSPAERDLVVFQVFRNADHANDNLAADAKLIAVVLQITTNAGDDS